MSELKIWSKSGVQQRTGANYLNNLGQIPLTSDSLLNLMDNCPQEKMMVPGRPRLKLCNSRTLSSWEKKMKVTGGWGVVSKFGSKDLWALG